MGHKNNTILIPWHFALEDRRYIIQKGIGGFGVITIALRH